MKPHPTNSAPGTFTDWEDVPEGTELLFYEGPARRRGHRQVDVASTRTC